jgi:lipopolysaccharide biosynthesis glycosyltransferase
MEFRVNAFIDDITSKYVKGYARVSNSPETKLNIDIYNGPELLGTVTANQYRPDLAAKGMGDGVFGFFFQFQNEIINLSQLKVFIKGFPNPIPLSHEARTLFFIKSNNQKVRNFKESDFDNALNFVFCFDRNFFEHFVVLLVSILEKHKNINKELIFHIVHERLKFEDFLILERLASKYKFNLNLFDITDKVKIQNFPPVGRYAQNLYYKMVFPEILPKAVKKVLYLDIDIIVNEELTELFNTDLKDKYLAAAVEEGLMPQADDQRKRLMLKDDTDYFNAGTMLINLEKWRNDNIKAKIIDFVNKYPYRIIYADQDLLNAIAAGDYIQLHPKYNVQWPNFYERRFKSPFSDDEFRKSKESPAIIHFIGPNKPWHILNRHPFKNLYWKYLNMLNFDLNI